jgi:NADPH:quinone reductase-like Zn-dependent oxidoreductase
VIGGVKWPALGTFASYIVVSKEEVILAPSHLTDEQVAAWPLAGVTAWRAAVVHSKPKPGSNILITGIGGGVALIALQLCVGKGANVFVTSGTQEKIDQAVKLGAKGGAIYKESELH